METTENWDNLRRKKRQHFTFIVSSQRSMIKCTLDDIGTSMSLTDLVRFSSGNLYCDCSMTATCRLSLCGFFNMPRLEPTRVSSCAKLCIKL
jgi:hypothetical protein